MCDRQILSHSLERKNLVQIVRHDINCLRNSKTIIKIWFVGHLAEEFPKIKSCYKGFSSQLGLVDCTKEASALDMVCLNFTKPFDHVFPDMLVHIGEFIVGAHK